MGWAYQIYAMAALCLKGEHHPGQFFFTHRAPLTLLADSIILTKDAPEIAEGEKDSSRAVPTHQGCFLPEVRSIAGNQHLICNMALPTFPSEAIDPTLARA